MTVRRKKSDDKPTGRKGADRSCDTAPLGVSEPFAMYLVGQLRD